MNHARKSRLGPDRRSESPNTALSSQPDLAEIAAILPSIAFRRFVDSPNEAIAVWRSLREPGRTTRLLVKMEDLPPFFIEESYLDCATEPVVNATMDDIVRLRAQIAAEVTAPADLRRLLATAGKASNPQRITRAQVDSLFRQGIGRS